jgi:hypothetical protein
MFALLRKLVVLWIRVGKLVIHYNNMGILLVYFHSNAVVHVKMWQLI